MHYYETIARVRNGFPVKVKAVLMPAEPDVGYMTSYLDDLQVSSIKGGSLPFELTDDELDGCHTAMMESLKEADHENEYDRF